MKSNVKGIIVLISLILSALGVTLFSLYPQVTSALSSVGDAFVLNVRPNLNTGTYNEIQASIDWATTEYGYIYIMFDISSIPEYAVVTDVRLLTYISYISPSTQGSCYSVTWAETNWAEDTITWNKQPSTGMPGAWQTALFNGPGYKAGWFTWSVGGTKEILMAHLKTDKKMAYVIFPDTQNKRASSHFINMRTKEYGGGFEPKLYVDYTIPSFTIQFIVKDQVGNPLPAKVTVDDASLTCNKTGVSPQTKITKTQVTVKAEIKVGTETYSSTETLTLTKSMTKEITITRRFFWTFFINYTDGTLATGKVIATSSKETLTIPIANGYGEAYLTDATYTFSFEASPAVTLKTATVTNDGDLVATIDRAKATAETSSTEQSRVVTPEVPWLLIPSIYIYALLGVLVFGFIIAAILRLRRPPK